MILRPMRTQCPGGSILSEGLPASPSVAWLRGASFNRHVEALGGVWKIRSLTD